MGRLGQAGAAPRVGTGVVIFIESNITVLVAGAISRPLFDRYRCSREKLAYIIDSTSAPICILIPMNAWGAYNLGILEGLGVENALTVFLQAIVFNFYAIAAVLIVLARHHVEYRHRSHEEGRGAHPRGPSSVA